MFDQSAYSVPLSPPPSVTPPYCRLRIKVIPHMLFRLLERIVYVWLHDGSGAWVYPLAVDEWLVYGYCWMEGAWFPCEFPWSEINNIY
ncbi:hypothetical protein LJC27_01365 [Christensenellaceae bacterium OttesenSCG-928-M15]|nr:hypothetical protein [Christensenellaceae bacterium OttesenSCG-928-M15]